jgi:hypothetical protein
MTSVIPGVQMSLRRMPACAHRASRPARIAPDRSSIRRVADPSRWTAPRGDRTSGVPAGQTAMSLAAAAILIGSAMWFVAEYLGDTLIAAVLVLTMLLPFIPLSATLSRR